MHFSFSRTTPSSQLHADREIKRMCEDIRQFKPCSLQEVVIIKVMIPSSPRNQTIFYNSNSKEVQVIAILGSILGHVEQEI